MGWDTALLRVSDQKPVDPQVHDLITRHLMLSIENLQAHAANYIGMCSMAQDSSMMYEFLRDSLPDGARARMAKPKLATSTP
jgi:hypothetical protein